VNKLTYFWLQLTKPGKFENEDDRLEYMTRVILAMMAGTLLFFTPIVFYLEIFEPPITDGIIIILFLDIPLILAWVLTLQGHWRIAGHIPPVIFLLLGFYGTWSYGFATTFLLFYVLVIVLAGMYKQNYRQFFVLGFILMGAGSLAWFRDQDLEMVLTPMITFSGLLIGTMLLQRLSSTLLRQSVDHANELAQQLTVEIGERKQIEKEIRKLNEELEERVHKRTAQLEASNKELEAFSYSISHDLRAPLRAVSGFNDLLLENYATRLDDEGRDYLGKVGFAAKKMNRLIDDLLALSRLGSRDITYKKINLTSTVKRIFSELVKEEPDREFNFTAAECSLVEVDGHLVEVMLSNLLSNAIKFTRRQNPAVIEFGCHKDKGETVFFVRDNGIGFDMKYVDKLFTPFQRLHTEREYEGTGIGLAIVSRVVQRHHGKIWVDSELDQGTTVYFQLNGESGEKGKDN
jgi:signal transduction histidine kinase